MPYGHVTHRERYVIYHLTVFGLGKSEIARRLSRHPTTIGRELKRNGPSHPDHGPYWCETAQRRAEARRMASMQTRSSIRLSFAGKDVD